MSSPPYGSAPSSPTDQATARSTTRQRTSRARRILEGRPSARANTEIVRRGGSLDPHGAGGTEVPPLRTPQSGRVLPSCYILLSSCEYFLGGQHRRSASDGHAPPAAHGVRLHRRRRRARMDAA